MRIVGFFIILSYSCFLHCAYAKQNVDVDKIAREVSDLFGVDVDQPAVVIMQDGRTRYDASDNTVYVSEEEYDEKHIAHEIAHAAISKAKDISRNEKIQEILAGYAEYVLTK